MTQPAYEPTDENTGLPPLDEPDANTTLWVAVFNHTQADAISPYDGSPQGSFVLGMRGLVNGINADSDWAQFFAAFPHGSVTALRDRCDAYLAEFPEDPDA